MAILKTKGLDPSLGARFQRSSRPVAMAMLKTKASGPPLGAHFLAFGHADRLQQLGPARIALPRRAMSVVCSAQRHDDGALPAASDGFSQTASYRSPSDPLWQPSPTVQYTEEFIEKTIFNFRFLTLLGVVGALTGSVLCFLKGCAFVVESVKEYFLTCLHHVGTGKVILLLVEAVDVYLMGTVMLIFGMGLFELFISGLDAPGSRTTVHSSNLFGLFRLREKPKWLEVRSLDELKTNLGHVIVMILLVGMFEKSKKVPIHSGTDLLCFSASILLSSGCLYFLSKLHSA